MSTVWQDSRGSPLRGSQGRETGTSTTGTAHAAHGTQAEAETETGHPYKTEIKTTESQETGQRKGTGPTGPTGPT